MSYACCIIKDIKHPEELELEAVREMLSTVPGVDLYDDEPRTGFCSDGQNMFQFSLDIVDEEGNSRLYSGLFDWDEEDNQPTEPATPPTTVNHISIQGAFDDPFAIWSVCSPIALRLGWRIFDHQMGDYIEMG